MGSAPLLDCAGRRRSPATFPGHHQGRPPRYKGLQYPPDPPTIEEIIAVMRVAGETPDGLRLRGLVVVLWRAGLRISEALALTESDLDAARGAILVRHGLCRIRHRPCYAESRVMPTQCSWRPISPAQRDIRPSVARHNSGRAGTPTVRRASRLQDGTRTHRSCGERRGSR